MFIDERNSCGSAVKALTFHPVSVHSIPGATYDRTVHSIPDGTYVSSKITGGVRKDIQQNCSCVPESPTSASF